MKYIHIMCDLAQKIVNWLGIDNGKVVTKTFCNMET